MPPRESDPNTNVSWASLMVHAKNSRTEIRNALQQNFCKTTIVKTNEGCKIFSLGNPLNSSNQTLLSADLPLKQCAEVINKKGNVIPESDIIEVKLEPVFKQNPFRVSAPSAEFSLMCERQRANVVHGLTDYHVQEGNMLLLAGDQIYKYSSSSSELYTINIGNCTSTQTIHMEVDGVHGCTNQSPPPSVTTASTTSLLKDNDNVSSNYVSDAKICPINSDIIAYVLNKQVYIEKSGRLLFSTRSNLEHVSNGVPPYICMEELERFDGIWWSEKEPRLLYEQVDETVVEEVAFVINGNRPPPPMKYPRVGSGNATSTLRMIIVRDEEILDVGLKINLKSIFPSFEYITRAGFFADGKTVWVQLMSRQQRECALVLIPETDFDIPADYLLSLSSSNKSSSLTDSLTSTSTPPSQDDDYGNWVPPAGSILQSTTIIHYVQADHWINVNNAIVPLSFENPQDPVYRFTYCLEMPSASSLYMIGAKIDKSGNCELIREQRLMAPGYSICKSIQVKVDEKRNLVYYVANETDPTEWNVCVSNYSDSSVISRKCLTQSGYSFRYERSNSNLAIDFDTGFVCWITSCVEPPTCRFYALRYAETDTGMSLPEAIFVAEISLSGMSSCAPRSIIPREKPEIMEYTSPTSGFKHYAMVLRPENFDVTKKYPVLHYVYGGPGIQIVHNDFTSWVPFVKYTRLGYIVIMIDNRGSANRGMDFEKHISMTLGNTEVLDQIEGLQAINDMTGGCMDMSRVIVHGWSYGGYMALLMLANHPRVYRGAIAGGAVTDWKLYDTAYTERYMGYPVQDQLYYQSSVLRLVDRLPNEPNRMLFIHGLLDENVHFSHCSQLIDMCNRRGKAYDLLIFPHERHGIRNGDSAAYMDARMMYFMQKSLNEPETEW